ncbi:MAG: QsdR family transcriptional regulator [Pseudomonadota bacterium]
MSVLLPNYSDLDQASPAYLAAQAEKSGERSRKRATAADAFRLARAMFDDGKALDMVALARELGVARGTLYRWANNRERLLADVMWSLAEELFEESLRVPTGTGAEALAQGIGHFIRGLTASEALRAAIHQDNEAVMSILTRRRGSGIQERAVAMLQAAIENMVRQGWYEPRLAPQVLAYAIVRIIEGFVYHDISAGIEPDLVAADQVVRTLL